MCVCMSADINARDEMRRSEMAKEQYKVTLAAKEKHFHLINAQHY